MNKSNTYSTILGGCWRAKSGPSFWIQALEINGPCQIISREIELGKIAVVLNENEQKDCAIAKLS